MNNDEPEAPWKRTAKTGGFILLGIALIVVYAVTLSEYVTILQGWFMLFMPIGF